MIQIASFLFNEFQENTYVAWDETLECIIIDPGCYKASEHKQLTDFISSKGLKPIKILNTHCHIDHILGNNYLCDHYKVPLYLHKEELKTYSQAARWTVMLGITFEDVPENHVFITENDKITFGHSTLDIALTPGHSIASLTFYNLLEKIALVGDVLFYESIGRTDLPGGDFNTLIHSIQSKLFVWDDDVKVYPGHGPATTIGHERVFNPFLI